MPYIQLKIDREWLSGYFKMDEHFEEETSKLDWVNRQCQLHEARGKAMQAERMFTTGPREDMILGLREVVRKPVRWKGSRLGKEVQLEAKEVGKEQAM